MFKPLVLTQLSLTHFRKWDQTFKFSPEMNIFIGPNGSGKTSVLEAISIVLKTKSFKTSDLKQVVKNGYSQTKIELNVNSNLKIENNFGLIKRFLISEKIYPSLSEYLVTLYHQFGMCLVIFEPQDHYLVWGGPAERRSYFDFGVFSFHKEMLQTLKNYKRVLQQKRQALESQASRTVIESFNELLIQWGGEIRWARQQYLNCIQPIYQNICRELLPHHSCAISYTGALSLQASLQDYIEHLRQQLYEKFSLEVRLKRVLVGPHLDDFNFTANDQPTKYFSSQGETRAQILGMKLAEVKLYQHNGYYPFILIDDFSSELDLERRQKLLELLSEFKLQIFVTCTELIPELQLMIQNKSSVLSHNF